MATLPSSIQTTESRHYNPDRIECRKGKLTEKPSGRITHQCEDYHAWGTKLCWVIDPDEPAFFEHHAGSAIVPVKQELSTDQFRVTIADLLAEVEQLS